MKTTLKYVGVAICMIVLYAALALRAYATPMLFGDNHYEFVQVSNPYVNNIWATASDAAAASVYNSVNGHLATITSQSENDFLFSLVSGSFSGFQGAWLGGKAPNGWLEGPESGQAFSYTNWGGSEPNNNGIAYMHIGSTSYHQIVPGKWADDSGVQGVPSTPSDPVIGYFVEYENTAIPEPSTFALLAMGALGLLVVARCKRK